MLAHMWRCIMISHPWEWLRPACYQLFEVVLGHFVQAGPIRAVHMFPFGTISYTNKQTNKQTKKHPFSKWDKVVPLLPASNTNDLTHTPPHNLTTSTNRKCFIVSVSPSSSTPPPHTHPNPPQPSHTTIHKYLNAYLRIPERIASPYSMVSYSSFTSITWF